jgi:hypothetical protein
MTDERAYVDDLQLVRTMLRLEGERRLQHISGEQLLQELGGAPYDDAQRQAFVELVHIAVRDELIVAQLGQQAGMADPTPNEYRYLANLRGFGLRTKGRDRANGREIIIGFPDPADDDGRPLPQRLLGDVGAAIGMSLAVEEAPSFLIDAGVPVEECPPTFEVEGAGAYIGAVLVNLATGGAAPGRRVVRARQRRQLGIALTTLV